VLPPDPARADLAQRRAVRPHEEAADDRVRVPGGGAPPLELLLAPEERDAQLGARGVVGGDVDRRARPVGQRDPQADDRAGCGRLGGG
jgi:hypothetical protein